MIIAIPVIFVMGFLGVLFLRLTFKGNVKLKVDYERNFQKTHTRNIVNIDKTIKQSAALDEPSNFPSDEQRESHIKIIREKKVKIVLPKHKTIVEIMREMKEGKNAFSPVILSKKDIDKKIMLPKMTEKPITKEYIPSGGNLPQDVSYRTPINIPVKYKVFTAKIDYDTFTKTHYGSYPGADFEKEMVVILISDDIYPNRVFEIIESETKKDKIIIKYRVNVFKMAEEEKDYYSVIVTKKNSVPIELKQII